MTPHPPILISAALVLLAPDGTHPSVAGNRRIVDELTRSIVRRVPQE